MASKPTIAVVEDDDSTRSILRTLFQRRGWDVVAVGTIAEGVDNLDPPPDFALKQYKQGIRGIALVQQYIARFQHEFLRARGEPLQLIVAKI